MHYLILYIILATIFMQSWRWSQSNSQSVMVLAAVNYVSGACFAWLAFWLVPDQSISLAIAGLGSLNGVIYASSLILIIICFKETGVGISTAVISCACTVPIIFAWLAWDEKIEALQWLAIILLPIALYLMRPVGPGVEKEHTPAQDLRLLALFLAIGCINVVHDATSVYGNDSHLMGYTAFVFLFAGLSSLSAVLIKKRKWVSKDVKAGLVVGVVNIFTTFSNVLALAVIPTALFFTTSSSILVVLNLLVAGFVWKEKLNRRQFIGIAIALLVIIFANAGDKETTQVKAEKVLSSP